MRITSSTHTDRRADHPAGGRRPAPDRNREGAARPGAAADPRGLVLGRLADLGALGAGAVLAFALALVLGIPDVAYAGSGPLSGTQCGNASGGGEILAFFNRMTTWLIGLAFIVGPLVFVGGLFYRASALGNTSREEMGNRIMGGSAVLVVGCILVAIFVGLLKTWAGC